MKQTLRYLLLSWLLVPSLAFGANQSWFVNTSCSSVLYSGYTNGSNGSGSSSTCASTNGGAGAFLTLDQAYAGINKNFVGTDINGTIDLQGFVEDASIADSSGFATDATRKLTLYVSPANRHPGFYYDQRYTLGNTNSFGVLMIGTKYMVVDGLQIRSKSTTLADNNVGIYIRDNSALSGGDVIIRDTLIIKAGTNTGANFGMFLQITPGNFPAGYYLHFFNNGISEYQYGVRCTTAFGITCDIMNNTILNTTVVGLSLFRFDTTSTIRAYNNLSQRASGSDYVLTGTDGTVLTGTNVTKDATSPNGGTYQNLTAVMGPQVLDFRLGIGDTSSYNRGTFLGTGSGFTTFFDYDHIDTARPQSTSFDVGANERIGTGPTPTPTPSLTKGPSVSLMGVGA